MLTVREVAARLRISERRVRKMLETGRIAATKKSGVWIIQEAALEKESVKVRKPGRPKQS